MMGATDFRLSALQAGTIALAMNCGAYMAEIIRAGIQSVDKGQMAERRILDKRCADFTAVYYVELNTGSFEYMRKHIEQMKEAIHDGVELIGYTCWGCTDLVSASTGEFKKRYGLIYVNKNDDGTGDFSRIRKDSFYWYKKVIESCGEKL